jgi:hypothetical protein
MYYLCSQGVAWSVLSHYLVSVLHLSSEIRISYLEQFTEETLAICSILFWLLKMALLDPNYYFYLVYRMGKKNLSWSGAISLMLSFCSRLLLVLSDVEFTKHWNLISLKMGILTRESIIEADVKFSLHL